MSKEDLTVAQQNMLQLLHETAKFRAVTPSMRELGLGTGIFSTNTISYNLDILESAGLVQKEEKIFRSVQITPKGVETITPGRGRRKA